MFSVGRFITPCRLRSRRFQTSTRITRETGAKNEKQELSFAHPLDRFDLTLLFDSTFGRSVLPIFTTSKPVVSPNKALFLPTDSSPASRRLPPPVLPHFRPPAYLPHRSSLCSLKTGVWLTVSFFGTKRK